MTPNDVSSAPHPSSPAAGRAAGIAAPKTVPLLHVSLSKTGEHVIRFADIRTPMRKAKPKDVACLELHISITPGSTPGNTSGGAPHPDVSADKRPANELIRTIELTRNPTTIKHPPEFMNAIEELTPQHSRAPMATYYARWSTGRNGKGAKGPWSMPVAMTVASISAHGQ